MLLSMEAQHGKVEKLFIKKMVLLKKEHLKIGFVYLIFGFGGFWHLLNVFQNIMRILASPLIILVSLLFLHDVFISLAKQFRKHFVLWSLIIVFFGLGVEYLGVKTHFPFGNYQYGQILKPLILQIPLAIGFAWLSICLASLVITLKIINKYIIQKKFYCFIIPILTALFMLIFDIFMENAATKLDYWTWKNNIVPIQNYLSWFLLGIVFSFLWIKLKLSIEIKSSFAIHVYISQLIYFILIIIK